jgi:hypothetical protein
MKPRWRAPKLESECTFERPLLADASLFEARHRFPKLQPTEIDPKLPVAKTQ